MNRIPLSGIAPNAILDLSDPPAALVEAMAFAIADAHGWSDVDDLGARAALKALAGFDKDPMP